MSVGTEKPPTIVVGALGIQSAVMFGGGADGQQERLAIDGLIRLPAFQAYAAERSGMSVATVMDWIRQHVAARASVVGHAAMLADYCDWHEQSGRWPAETPFGELK